jgi:hypothetical protein
MVSGQTHMHMRRKERERESVCEREREEGNNTPLSLPCQTSYKTFNKEWRCDVTTE